VDCTLIPLPPEKSAPSAPSAFPQVALPVRETGVSEEENMTDVLSTREVARRLGVPVGRLSRAVWEGRIPEPRRLPGGAFGWTDADIARACRCLLHRSYEEVVRERTGQ